VQRSDGAPGAPVMELMLGTGRQSRGVGRHIQMCCASLTVQRGRQHTAHSKGSSRNMDPPPTKSGGSSKG